MNVREVNIIFLCLGVPKNFSINLKLPAYDTLSLIVVGFTQGSIHMGRGKFW